MIFGDAFFRHNDGLRQGRTLGGVQRFYDLAGGRVFQNDDRCETHTLHAVCICRFLFCLAVRHSEDILHFGKAVGPVFRREKRRVIIIWRNFIDGAVYMVIIVVVPYDKVFSRRGSSDKSLNTIGRQGYPGAVHFHAGRPIGIYVLEALPIVQIRHDFIRRLRVINIDLAACLRAAAGGRNNGAPRSGSGQPVIVAMGVPHQIVRAFQCHHRFIRTAPLDFIVVRQLNRGFCGEYILLTD
ncbi:hypothetical protein SDC9_138844 [bioreactor metagenome]|uniref:Uncharacterized protein n=1 Tax=bioreactor metagenome TaxID=1076179 RepID=A0A645DTE6_9ZZZZ